MAGPSATLMGVIAIAAIILAGPGLTAPGYSVIAHSISELGAQNTPFSWLMNVGFAAFGLGVIVDAAQRLKGAPWVAASFLVFGFSLFGVAAFSHSPIDPAAAFDQAQSFYERTGVRRFLCWAACAAALALFAAMAAVPEAQGLLQRAMFLSSFIWLPVFLPPQRPEAAVSPST